ncbi:MAG: methyltransferase domain-containing protein [Acidimicrobiales bacterium]
MTDDHKRSKIAGYYDDYSTWYEGERREGYYSLINDLEVERIQTYARGGDILEIGVGTGLILERTSRVATRAVGIDLSLGMAGVSKAKGLDVANASVNDLPFPDDSFDVAYSCKVLPHVPDIVGGLEELARVVRPGGTMLVEFYNPLSFKGLTYRIMTRKRGHEPVFVRHDTVRDIEGYVPAGWHIEAVRGIRVLAATGQFYTAPVLGSLIRFLDRRLADSGIARRFGGYLLVTLRPDVG